MPNTEVKLTNAESTWPEAAREDRKLLIKEKTLTNVGVFFSYAGASYPDGLPGIAGEHLLRLIGHFVLVFIPMKLDIVWFHRYFIFFLKR